LDLIRAFAIVWVMVYHGSLFNLVSDENPFVRFGWMGVDLFFVLSGFLIAGQLLKPFARGLPPDYPRFFARRLLRTLPVYLAMVLLYFAVPATRDRPVIQPLWQFLTFTENLLADPSTPKAFSHVWSLCVEEQFYLLLPCVLAVVMRKPSITKAALALAAVWVGGMMLRALLWLKYVAVVPFDPGAAPDFAHFMKFIYYPSWSRLDGLVAGVAAAAIQTFRPAFWQRLTRRPNLLLIAGIAGVVASTWVFQEQVARFWPTVFGFPLLAAGIAAIVVAASSTRSLAGRWPVPGAGALAAGSYSLYLSHKAVFRVVEAIAASPATPLHALRLPVAMFLAFVAGAALYRLVERPFLLFRDRLEGPSRSLTAMPSSAPA